MNLKELEKILNDEIKRNNKITENDLDLNRVYLCIMKINQKKTK